MRRRRGSAAVASALALVLALAASACGVIGDDGDAFTIGAIYPISGRQGPGGVDEARGARLAVELANREGGVDGRRIELQLVDVDAGAAAPAAMRDLKADGADIVLGTYGSTISAPAAATAAREDMLLWETGAVGELTGDDGAQPGRSFFRIAPQGGRLGQAAVEFVRGQLSPLLGVDPAPLRYAVAYVDDSYGRAVGLGAVHEVERSGGVLAGAFPYDVHRLDAAGAADLVSRIGEARPDVLFVSAYLDDGIAIRQATLAAHLPLKASIGTSSSYCMPAFAAALGGGAVGLFASDKPDGAQVKEEALTDEGRRTLHWAGPVPRPLPGGHERGRPVRLRQRLGPGGPCATGVGVGDGVDGAGGAGIARAGGGGGRRPRPQAPRRHPGQRRRARSGRSRPARRGREPGRGQRHLAVGRRPHPGGGVAAGLRHPPPRRHPHPDLMAARRHPPAVGRGRGLGVGLGLGAVYLLVAVATMVLSDRPFRPLFDGLAPPPPYRWVNPPAETARDNQQPAAARRDFSMGPDGSPFINVTPEDGQAILLLAEEVLLPHPPDTTVEVAVTPLDVLTLGPLPEDMRPESNAYQVSVAYRPSGEVVTDFEEGTSSISVTAAGASDFLLYSRDGQSWDRRETQPIGSGHGLETRVPGPGTTW